MSDERKGYSRAVVDGMKALEAPYLLCLDSDGQCDPLDFGRFWETIDRLSVTIFYTAPTAIRALEREGDEWVTRHKRSSLRLLGTVGEPINPDAWEWYWRVVGGGRIPIVDTWWQTETGGILIAPFPGATELKPGSATKPLPGVHPVLVDSKHRILDCLASGNLCIAQSWPGQMRTVWSAHARFFQTYFTTYPGFYFTGDGCRRVEDGYYWSATAPPFSPTRMMPSHRHMTPVRPS